MTQHSYHQLFTHGHRSIRHLMLGGAVLVTVAVGLVTPPAVLADGCPTTEALAAHGGLSPEARHIALLEGRDPANCPATDATAFVPISQEALHIALLEGRDPANFPAVASLDEAAFTGVAPAEMPTVGVATASGAVDATEFVPISPEARRIALLEGRDPANFPAADATTFVPISQEARHIQLLEGRDPANVSATAVDHSDAVAASADGPHASHTAY